MRLNYSNLFFGEEGCTGGDAITLLVICWGGGRGQWGDGRDVDSPRTDLNNTSSVLPKICQASMWVQAAHIFTSRRIFAAHAPTRSPCKRDYLPTNKNDMGGMEGGTRATCPTACQVFPLSSSE